MMDEFAARVRERFSDARLWASGSRARGEATWESDFDIFVVLSEVDKKQALSGSNEFTHPNNDFINQIFLNL